MHAGQANANRQSTVSEATVMQVIMRESMWFWVKGRHVTCHSLDRYSLGYHVTGMYVHGLLHLYTYVHALGLCT